MAIGKKLDELIELRHRNPNEVSKATGVAVSTIYNLIKRDSPKTDINNLYRLSYELHVPLTYFVDEAVLKELPLDEQQFEPIE